MNTETKRAVILHGTDGRPSHNWQPWARQIFTEAGYDVLQPELPGNHTPNQQIYNDFLFGQNWDFTDNVLIGHSSGATAILNLLMDSRCPQIKTAVLVGTFLEVTQEILDAGWYEQGQFDGLFPAEGFDWGVIKQKCPKFYFVHGSDDPVCPIELAQKAADTIGGKFIVIQSGGHLTRGTNTLNIPPLLEVLKSDNIL